MLDERSNHLLHNSAVGIVEIFFYGAKVSAIIVLDIKILTQWKQNK